MNECKRESESGKTIAVAYVVRSFQTCDTSAGKLDFRTSREEAGRVSSSGRQIKRGSRKKVSQVTESPEVDAGWSTHLLKVLSSVERSFVDG